MCFGLLSNIKYSSIWHVVPRYEDCIKCTCTWFINDMDTVGFGWERFQLTNSCWVLMCAAEIKACYRNIEYAAET